MSSVMVLLIHIPAVKKILLLPPKYEILMVPSNHSFFQYYNSNIGLFSIAPCKVITLDPLCILFVISSLFFFYGFLSKVIALPTIAIAIAALFLPLKGESNKITVTFR